MCVSLQPHLMPAPPCRFLLDNPAVCRGHTVLDLGSGCGAAAIAAKLSGAAHVVANDIDTGVFMFMVMFCCWALTGLISLIGVLKDK